MSVEGIQFYDFNSVNEGLRLFDRKAPDPEEKQIIENIPYSQGVIDFSMLLGERVFENRTLTYTLHSENYLPYKQRKAMQQRIRRVLNTKDIGALYDTANWGYHWNGKITKVDPVDNPQFGRIDVEIEFSAYPFLIRNKRYFDDNWDDFDLNNDVAGYTQFDVTGERTILLYNSGDTTVKPMIRLEVD